MIGYLSSSSRTCSPTSSRLSARGVLASDPIQRTHVDHCETFEACLKDVAERVQQLIVRAGRVQRLVDHVRQLPDLVEEFFGFGWGRSVHGWCFGTQPRRLESSPGQTEQLARLQRSGPRRRLRCMPGDSGIPHWVTVSMAPGRASNHLACLGPLR